MTMRVLNLLGVDVGPPDGLVPAGPGGPKGFWERREIIRLNDRLLRSLGGSWRTPPPLPPGWEMADDLADRRGQAHEMLEQTFSGRPLWGWKDPRSSLTTAFWQQLVPDLRFVICIRNPIDAADSLSPPSRRKEDRAFYYSRQGVEGERAYRLWMTYLASALANTSGRPRLLVSYEEFFEDRARVVERLARFVGLEPPQAAGDVDQAITDFIDDDLCNYRTELRDVISDVRLPEEVASLCLSTEFMRAAQAAVGSDRAPAEDLDALGLGLDAYARRLLDATSSEAGAPSALSA